jgi:hypothetical protein
MALGHKVGDHLIFDRLAIGRYSHDFDGVLQGPLSYGGSCLASFWPNVFPVVVVHVSGCSVAKGRVHCRGTVHVARPALHGSRDIGAMIVTWLGILVWTGYFGYSLCVYNSFKHEVHC